MYAILGILLAMDIGIIGYAATTPSWDTNITNGLNFLKGNPNLVKKR